MAVTAAELIVLVRAEGVAETASALAGLSASADGAALGLGALAIAGAATIGALGGSIAEAAKFQTTLLNVQNNTTMTTAQVGAMRESVLKLGSETGAPLEQLTGGFMHAMNITGDLSASMDILKIATESAVSTGGKASDTTNILANAMHEYGADVSHAATEQERHNEILANATRYMGIFHLASAEGNMTLEDFANNSGKSVAAAANLHVPVEQVAAAFSALTRHGFDAATANTQLSNILFHMAAPSKAAAKELGALSKASGVDLVSDFSAAGLASKGLDGVMTDLQTAFAKTGRSTQDQSSLLATLDGSLESNKQKFLDQGMSEAKATEEAMKLINAQRGGLGLAVLMGTANTDYKNSLRDMTDQQLISTVTQDAFNRSAQTVGFQFARLKVNMQELGITLGSAALPGLAQLLTAINLVFPAVERFVAAHASMIAAVMAAAGSFAVLVAAHALLAPSIGAVVEAIGAVAAVLTGPFALALLAGGLLVRAYATNWHGFGTAVNGAVDVTKAALAGLVAAFRTGDFNAAFGTIITAVDKAFGAGAAGKVTLFVSTALRGLQLFRDTVITVTEALRGEWVPSAAIQPFVNAVGIATTKARELAESARGLLAPALAFLREHFLAISTVVGVAISALLGMPLALLAVWTGAKLLAVAWAEDFHGIREITATVAAAIGTVLASLGGTFSTLGTAVRGALDAAGARLSAFGTLIHDTLGNAVTVAVSAVGATFSTLGTTVSGALSTVGGAFSAFGTTIHNSTAAIRDLASTIGAGLHGALTALAGILGTVGAAFGATSGSATAIGAAFQAIGTAARTSVTALGEVATALANIVRQGVGGYFTLLGMAIQPLLPLLGQLAQFLGGVLVVAIGVGMGAIGGLAGFITNTLAGALRIVTGTLEIVSGGIQIFAAILTGVINVVTDLIHGNWTAAWHDAGTALSKAFDGMKMQVLGLADVLMGAFQTMFGSILGAVGGFGATVVGYFADVYQKTTGQTAPWAAGMIKSFQDLSTQSIGTTQQMHDKIAQLLNIGPEVTASGSAFSGWGDKLRAAFGGVATAIDSTTTAIQGYRERGADFNNTISGMGSAALSLASSMNTGAAAASNYDKALQGIGTKGGELKGYLSTLQTQWDALNLATDNGAHVTAAQQTQYQRLAPSIEYLNGAVGANTDQTVAATIAATSHVAAIDNVVVATDKVGQVAATTAIATDKVAAAANNATTANTAATVATTANATANSNAAGATDKATTATNGAATAVATTTTAIAANTIALADQGAKMGTAAVGQAVIKTAMEATGKAAATAATQVDTLTAAIKGVPATLTVTVTTPGAAEAPAAINAITTAVATVPKSFTVTAVVDTSAALAAIANLDAHMPHSPAKTGPFSTPPNWNFLFSALPAAFNSAGAAFDAFGATVGPKFANAGRMAVQGLTNGMNALGASAADAAIGMAAGVNDAMVNFFEIASPSKKTHAHGRAVAQGLTNGIAAATPAAAKAAADLAVSVSKGITDTLAAMHLLSTYDFATGSPSGGQFAMLGTLTAQMVATIQDAAKGFGDAGLKATTLFAEAAGKVGGMIKNVLTGLADLAAFNFAKSTPTAEQFGMLTTLTVSLVQTIQDAAAQFNDIGLKSATTFAEAAGKVGGMVKNALAGLSELANFDFAKNTPTGQQMGMLTTLVVSLVQTIEEASVAFSGQGLKSATLFAESAGKVGGMVKNALAALSELASFDFAKNTPTGSAMGLFRQMITDVVLNIVQAATAFTDQGIKAAAAFAESATKVMGLITAGVAAFDKLATFIAPPAAAIYAFGKALRAAMNDLALVAEQVTQDAAASAAKFAESASKVVGMIGSGVTAFEKLATFHAVPTAAIYAFGKALRAAINDFALLSEQITPDATKAAATFAEGAGKVVGIIGAGVDGFTKLADFAAPASSAIYAFGKTLRAVINDLALVAEQVTQQATDSAAKFATGATTVLGVFGNGIAGLMDLAKFVAPSEKAIDDFAYAVGHLVERFANAARMIGEQGVVEAGKFGTAAKLAVDTIKVGLEAFTLFKKMVVPSAEAIDTLVAGVTYVVGRFRDMANAMGHDALTKAQAFGTAVEHTAKSIQTAIGTFKSLTEPPFKGALTKIMTEFNGDFDQSLAMMIEAHGKAAQFETEARMYKEAMLNAATSIAAGNAALANAALPGNSLGRDMKAAGQNLGNALHDAVRDTLQIKSPSQVMVAVGQQVVAGLVGGMSSTQQAAVAKAAALAKAVADAVIVTLTSLRALGNLNSAALPSGDQVGAFLASTMQVVNAVAAAASAMNGKALDAAVKFAEGAGKVLGFVGSAVTALTGLAALTPPAASAIYAFDKTLRLLVNDFALTAEQVGTEMLGLATTFSTGAGAVADAVGKGVAGLTKLASYVDPAPAAIYALGKTLRLAIQDFAALAALVGKDMLAEATSLAAGAGKVADTVGKGVAGLGKLVDYVAPPAAAVYALGKTLRLLVADFAALADLLGNDAIASAGRFADSAGKVVGIIGNAVDGFTKLAAYKGIDNTLIGPFVETVRTLITAIGQVAAQFTTEGLTLAGRFADTAAKAVGILSNGVDGFTKLRDYKGVGDAAIAAFVATVTTFLRGITQVSTQFSVEGLALAGKFAETAGKVVALLGNGVAGFAALAKFVAPSDASIGVFLNSIATLTATLVNALPRYGADQLTAAGQFADTASKVVGLLASGVAGFAELAKFTTPTSASIGEFIRVLTDITSRFTWYAPIFAAGQLAAAQLFADTASKVVGMIGNGVAGFAALAGFVAPSDAAIAEFVRVLTDITSRVAWYMPTFATGQLVAAQLFAETAGKVAAIIGGGVSGLMALHGFVAPSNQAIAEFVRVLTDITSRVAWYMPTFATGQLAAAQLFAETAGKVTAIIGAGVKGFDALADFRAPTTRTLDEFAWSVGQIVARLVNVAGWFNANGVTAAGAFADSAGKILAIVGSGVQGLTSLFSFVAPGLGALDAFAGAVRGMVARFAWIAGTLSGDGVKAAAEFGAATGTIFGALQSATGFFKSLNGLLLPDRAGIDRLLAPIINTLVAVTSAAQQIGAGGLAAATAFSTAVSAVFGALNAAKPAVAGMVPPGLGGGGGGGGGGAGGITVVFNQNAPIYGVADLQNAIVSGVIEAKRRGRL